MRQKMNVLEAVCSLAQAHLGSAAGQWIKVLEWPSQSDWDVVA